MQKKLKIIGEKNQELPQPPKILLLPNTTLVSTLVNVCIEFFFLMNESLPL